MFYLCFTSLYYNTLDIKIEKLVLSFLIIQYVIIKKWGDNIIKYLIAIGIGSGLLASCLQHLIHEFSHVLAAMITGEKVTHIQWFTYHGGSRVFYENEPDLNTENINKKWIFIAGAGFLVTTLLGYLFTMLYFIVSNNWLKIILCLFAFIFIISDSLYFLIGSILNFGDVIGIRKTLKMPKWLSIILCAGIFTVHCIAIKIWFW